MRLWKCLPYSVPAQPRTQLSPYPTSYPTQFLPDLIPNSVPVRPRTQLNPCPEPHTQLSPCPEPRTQLSPCPEPRTQLSPCPEPRTLPLFSEIINQTRLSFVSWLTLNFSRLQSVCDKDVLDCMAHPNS